MAPKKVPAPEVKKTTTTFTVPQKLATLSSWSYSVYTSWLRCPAAVCYDKIKRIKIFEPENPAFVKGNAVHKFAEDYIAGRLPAKEPIHPGLKQVQDRVTTYRKVKAMVEQDWAFTKEWVPTKWNDWTHCWLRIKVDVCAVTEATKKAPPLVHITDWKSGKVYEEHKQQRSLYALGGLQLVELGLLAGGNKDTKVVAEHLYTDTTQSATEEYSLKDLKPLKSEWLTRTKQMMADTKYEPKPGYHCRWCRFRASNGGPCEAEQKS
jgi:hypothetical protein